MKALKNRPMPSTKCKKVGMCRPWISSLTNHCEHVRSALINVAGRRLQLTDTIASALGENSRGHDWIRLRGGCDPILIEAYLRDCGFFRAKRCGTTMPTID